MAFDRNSSTVIAISEQRKRRPGNGNNGFWQAAVAAASDDYITLQIAKVFDVHYSTVSRTIKRQEKPFLLGHQPDECFPAMLCVDSTIRFSCKKTVTDSTFNGLLK